MKIPQKLIELSRRDREPVKDRVFKVGEEYGELAKEIQYFVGKKKDSRTLTRVEEDVIEEAIDVIIAAMDVIAYLGRTNEEELEKIFMDKLQKWKQTLDSQKL